MFVGVDAAKERHWAQAMSPQGEGLFEGPVANDQAAAEALLDRVEAAAAGGGAVLVVDMVSSAALLLLAVAAERGTPVAYRTGLANAASRPAVRGGKPKRIPKTPGFWPTTPAATPTVPPPGGMAAIFLGLHMPQVPGAGVFIPYPGTLAGRLLGLPGKGVAVPQAGNPVSAQDAGNGPFRRPGSGRYPSRARP